MEAEIQTQIPGIDYVISRYSVVSLIYFYIQPGLASDTGPNANADIPITRVT
jgi:hypothetical protein